VISIIVPVLNEAKAIASLIADVEGQPGAKELIVVDGGSTDGTAEMLDGRGRLMRSGPGRAKQMNLGASAAKGDILLFLHCDTRLPPGALARIQEAMRDPKVAGGAFTHRFDKDGWYSRFISLSANTRGRLFKLFLGDQAIFVRRETFRAVGGYRELPIFEDLDLSSRLRAAGRLTMLDDAIRTSARRIERWGKGKSFQIWWGLSALYMLGVPPSKLSRYYNDVR